MIWSTKVRRQAPRPERFDFNTVFDAEVGGGERLTGELDPLEADTFGRKELEAVRAKAHEAGFAAGVEQERNATARLESETLAAISDRLAALEESHRQGFKALSKEAARLALAIARKVAGRLVERQPTAEIEALVDTCLARLQNEPRIVVRVADDLVDALGERLDHLAARSGFGGRIILLGEDTLSGSDCRVEWANGGAERDTAALWSRIDKAVERRLATPEDGAPTAPER